MGTPPAQKLVKNGEFVGRNLDFFTLSANADVSGADDTTMAKLNTVIETISTKAQPIIISTGAFGSGATVIKFAVEHTGVWAAADLKAALEAAVAGVTFTVTKADVL